jgi:dynein intermediate chain 1, axonemal
MSRRPKPIIKKKKGKARQNKQEEIHDDMSDNQLGDGDMMNPDLQTQKDIDHISLNTEQREEVITKALNSNNPYAPHNETKYSYKDKAFKKDELVDQMVVHFALDNDIIQKDSDEHRDQEDFWDIKEQRNRELLDFVNEGIKDEEFSSYRLDDDQRAQKKSLRNTFNFQERACQTFNLPLREKGMKTDPPQCSQFSLETTQWQIFDRYMNEYQEILRLEHEEAMKSKKKEKKSQQQVQQVREDPLYSQSMKRALKIMERMIVQSADYDKFSDYKYYHDETEGTDSPNTGSVLPLWRFSTDKSRRKQVTSICWNPKYKDLFAVGYGSYDFLKETSGLICCYTIKNPTWPEYSFTTESGVMCLDFHSKNPALLAVGLYDGTVMVFDIRAKTNKAIYQSTVRTMKHTDPVWQVAWDRNEMLFFSISSDGRVTKWTLMKNKLEPEEVLKLKLVLDQDKELVDNKKESFLYGLAGGMCLDFNPFNDHQFLVGTEEGKIHLCSKAYSGQYLETYEGHFLAVYSVKWNKYHERVFLSCSADWKIKMWDCTITRPILSYDLGCAVGDVEWAPYSSTVFAAVIYTGQLYVYDLCQEKHKFMCEHTAMKDAVANHVAFNQEDPIILVGDAKGGVNSFILSKNLKRGPLEPKNDEEAKKSPQELERDKMERFLDTLDKEVY